MILSLYSDSQVDSAFQYLRSSPEITDIIISVYNPGDVLQRSVQSILLSDDVQIAQFDYIGEWTEEVSLRSVSLYKPLDVCNDRRRPAQFKLIEMSQFKWCSN